MIYKCIYNANLTPLKFTKSNDKEVLIIEL